MAITHVFHRATVARIIKETADARTFVLVPDEPFPYRAGQYCTFRITVDGEDLYRSYSMSSAPETAIHHSAGTRSSTGIPACAGLEAAARAGSLSPITAGDSNSPGAAATSNAARHPCACATGPLTAALSMTPTGTAIMNPAMARARCPAGTRSPIQLAAAGVQTASPIPTPSRVASSMA